MKIKLKVLDENEQPISDEVEAEIVDDRSRVTIGPFDRLVRPTYLMINGIKAIELACVPKTIKAGESIRVDLHGLDELFPPELEKPLAYLHQIVNGEKVVSQELSFFPDNPFRPFGETELTGYQRKELFAREPRVI